MASAIGTVCIKFLALKCVQGMRSGSSQRLRQPGVSARGIRSRLPKTQYLPQRVVHFLLTNQAEASFSSWSMMLNGFSSNPLFLSITQRCGSVIAFYSENKDSAVIEERFPLVNSSRASIRQSPWQCYLETKAPPGA